MELQIFSPSLSLLGVLDQFESLRWISRYYEAGEFELVAPLTPLSASLLSRENVIRYETRSGYIETVQKDMTEEGEVITATGKTLAGYLGRRINWSTINFTGTAENFMRQIVNQNCISTAGARMIPNLILGESAGLIQTITKQNSYGNVLDVLTEIARQQDIGFTVSLDAASKKLVFSVYEGSDRSAGTANPLIFSRDHENILEQTYIESSNGYANIALVAGDGEGAARKIETIGDSAGLDRFELFVDARDIQQGDLTDEQYSQSLLQRGREKLSECYLIRTFDAVVNAYGALGDIVTVIDHRWELSVNSRITEIEEIWEHENTQINIIFGNNVPTQYNMHKRRDD